MGAMVDIGKMKIEAVARIFAETGIKTLFLHIHELLQKHQDKEQVIKLRGTWVPISPSQWRTRMDMTVNIGLGIGTREQNLLHLSAIWDKQKDIIEHGGLGTLVTPINIFNTAAELVKNANLKQPEMFFTRSEQMPQQNDQLAQQQMQLAQKQQQLDAEKNAFNVAKLQQKHQTEMLELERKRQVDSDNFTIALEKISNQLTEFELKYGQNVPGARV